MRRRLATLACCLVLVLAGCAGTGIAPDDEPEAAPAAETPSAPPDGSIEVHSINVGQADATLLRTDGETMLIDSGDWRDDGEAVLSYLDARGVDRIDHLVSTHGHADHIGGHEAVIDHYETEGDGIGAVYDSGTTHTSQTYERYLDAIERHDVTLFEVREGDEIPFDGTATTVLNPAEPPENDLHADSVAVRVAVGDTSFLFTGDAERGAEARMLDAHGDRLEADVYHAGHHGSNTSSGPEFLDTVDPAVAIVSSAHDSQYGHPHDEPLERFAERDAAAVWTGVHGTTVLESDGETVTVRAQHDATTDPLGIQAEPEATADPSAPADEQLSVGVAPLADRAPAVAPEVAST